MGNKVFSDIDFRVPERKSKPGNNNLSSLLLRSGVARAFIFIRPEGRRSENREGPQQERARERVKGREGTKGGGIPPVRVLYTRVYNVSYTYI